MPNQKNISSPVTVISNPRSGTTLISELFKLHPSFSSVGETGNLICDSWHAVEFARGITKATFDKEQIVPTEEKAGRIVRQTFLTLFKDGKKEWFQKPIGLPKALSNKFDKTQWDEAAEWYWKIYRHSFPQAKLFTLLRHPCDVVLSTAKHLGFEPASTWWTLGFMSYLLTHPACPIDYAVHYEVLVENQEAVTKNLFDYLNVPFNPAVMKAFSTVHVPSRGRENIGTNFSSRQTEWSELDPSIIDPFYVEHINKLFKKFNYTIQWPSHFENSSFQAIDENQEENPSDLLATIDRLNKNIESIHLDHADKQIKLHNKIYKANKRFEEESAKRQRLQNELDSVLYSRGGRWLMKYWETAHKIKAFTGTNDVQSSAPAAAVQTNASAQPNLPVAPTSIKKPNLSIDLKKEKSAVFVLPSGFTLGGVTSWSMEMCRRLVVQNKPAALIKYKNIGSDLNLTQPPAGQIIYCDGAQIPASREVVEFTADYAKALPGTIIPNYNHRTYAVCATISQDHAEALRLIGYAHTDEDSYYALLFFYESIIHRFIAVSDEIGKKLRQLIPHREKDIIVRPYGVAVSNDLNRSYSPADEPLQITYAGRISTVQKRILDLVPLTEHLAQLGVHFQLNIVGDGSEKANLEQRVAALPPAIQQRIALKEPVAPDQMSRLWADTDICVLVSEYEGTSISLLEAMAQGCVPVVTEVSGVQAVLTYGENGFFHPVGGLGQMAQLIQELDTGREQLAAVGQQAHQTVKDRYSYDEYLAWFNQLTETVWQESPKSWPKNKPTMTDWKSMKQLAQDLNLRLKPPADRSRKKIAPRNKKGQQNLLIIGMSHSIKIKNAAMKEPNVWYVENVHFKTAEMLKDNSADYSNFTISHQIPQGEIDIVCMSIFGNEFNILSLIERDPPFTVGDAHQGIATRDKTGRHFIPRSMLKHKLQKIFEERNTFSLIRSLHNQFKDCSCVLVAPPPPIIDEEHLLKHLDDRSLRLAKIIAPKEIRFACYDLHIEILEEFCEIIGLPFLHAPEESKDETGALKRSLWGNDLIHANLDYGHMVLNQLRERL